MTTPTDVGVMPTAQINAHLDESLTMRVGVPHSGGKLAFHAFNEGFKVMVSASAFWNRTKGQFTIPEATDLHEGDIALDSAGFTAVLNWKNKGRQDGMAGVFPWSVGQYLELAGSLGVSWYSAPDLCCEPEIASSQAEIDYRIDASATLLEGTLRTLYAWQNALTRKASARIVANMIRPPVPIAQGW